jgi:hypothetical protein
MTSRVWGYVNRFEEAVAAYFVEWTPGHEANQANFDLIIGRWGENTHESDRQAVSLEFRKFEGGPSFMIIDSTGRSVARSTLISKALNRTDVIGTSIEPQVFAICDVIFLEDARLSILRI